MNAQGALLCRVSAADAACRHAVYVVRETVLRWCARWAWSLFLVVGACQPPPAHAGPLVTVEELVAATGDTASYIVRWTAPLVGANQLPISGYLIRLIHAGVDTFVFHSQSPSQLVDTMRTPRPLTLTDSIGPMSVAVITTDTKLNKSAPAQTSTWWIKRKVLPPSPPGGVTVDSTSIARIDVRPNVVAATVGMTVQLCGFATLVNGTKGMFQYGKVFGGTDSMRVDTLAYCQQQFQLYLTEAPA